MSPGHKTPRQPSGYEETDVEGPRASVGYRLSSGIHRGHQCAEGHTGRTSVARARKMANGYPNEPVGGVDQIILPRQWIPLPVEAKRSMIWGPAKTPGDRHLIGLKHSLAGMVCEPTV